MIEVEVEDQAWLAALPTAEAVVVQAATAALHAVSAGADGVEISVLLTDDESVRALNSQFRHKDSPTNFLSFPAPETARPHLGDVALAHGVCVREAEAQGKPLAAHLAHLTAHGVLHLLGYDHDAEAEAEEMEGLERVIMAGLGLPDPYENDVQS